MDDYSLKFACHRRATAMLACGPWLLATGMQTSYGVARRPEQLVHRLSDGLRLFGPTRYAGLRSSILACADSMPGVLANRSMRGNQQFDAEIVLGDERSRAGVFIAGLLYPVCASEHAH